MNFPSGTVTFLFSDIEASSHLWEVDPAQMQADLVTHDALLEAEIKNHDGLVFKRVGDEFCTAFVAAQNALQAAFSVQRKLNSMPIGESIKVRIAIHTGTAELRDDDYYGISVNRTARILALGHGGQILLSQITENLCEDFFQNDATFVDLGEVTLRGMTRSERVFQASTDDLQALFPPLRRDDSSPNFDMEQSSAALEREAETTKAILAKAQAKSGTAVNRDALLKAAAELGIPASAVAQAEKEFRRESGERELRNQFFKERRGELIASLWKFSASVIFFTGIWYFTGMGFFWPAFVFISFIYKIVQNAGMSIKDGPHLNRSFERWKLRRQYESEGRELPKSLKDKDYTEYRY